MRENLAAARRKIVVSFIKRQTYKLLFNERYKKLPITIIWRDIYSWAASESFKPNSDAFNSRITFQSRIFCVFPECDKKCVALFFGESPYLFHRHTAFTCKRAALKHKVFSLHLQYKKQKLLKAAHEKHWYITAHFLWCQRVSTKKISRNFSAYAKRWHFIMCWFSKMSDLTNFSSPGNESTLMKRDIFLP